jgi:nucleoside-diphosphate-sugar epimerase
MLALIGSTGFIGGNLRSQIKFDKLFNSKNIKDISNNDYEHIVCAGLPGTKWYANKFPEEDIAKINLLKENLSRTSTCRFTLISTIDVYDSPQNVTEKSLCDNKTPYGKNRLMFENFILNNFKNVRILRLPIVFGKGFKKNYLYDMINKNNIERICLDSLVQFYDVSDLPEGINNSWKSIPIIRNMATEPLLVRDIAEKYFPKLIDQMLKTSPFKTNMKTNYHESGYIFSSKDLLAKIGLFLNETIYI